LNTPPSERERHNASHRHAQHESPLVDTGIKARGALDKKPTPLMVGDSARATMYVCGVTVYDHSHLGHARSACAFDAIARHLRSKVDTLIFARNITDIDDKILNRAKERGMDWRELARSMELSMREDFRALGCQDPDIEPRATEHIPEMIRHIGRLLEMGLAYVDDQGSVWQDGLKGRAIGSVSGRKAEDLWSEARVEAHPGKRSARDFVLWKAAKPGEPSWEAPWGLGRPGWHIECSAMSRKSLGDTLDIHGGGEDLKFPHHECECAQSEPVTGAPLARKWLHNGFVVLPSAKGGFDEMHKSSGNALNIKALLRVHPGEAIRAWALGAHYRQPLPYSEQSLESARARAWRWAMAKESTISYGALDSGSPDPQVVLAMDADFNTPLAFSRLDAMAKAVRSNPSDLVLGSSFLASLERLGMGWTASCDLEPPRAASTEESRGRLAELIGEREKARAAKDWGQADRIRAEAAALGFEIVDSASGPVAKPRALKP
jgi:cysteinyl-tRNA synthetase